MKKIFGIIAGLFIALVSTPVIADNIQLMTNGLVASEVANDGSVLVYIQGEMYAVEDSEEEVLESIEFGDKVMLCFELNEEDRLAKLFIVGKF